MTYHTAGTLFEEKICFEVTGIYLQQYYETCFVFFFSVVRSVWVGSGTIKTKIPNPEPATREEAKDLLSMRRAGVASLFTTYYCTAAVYFEYKYCCTWYVLSYWFRTGYSERVYVEQPSFHDDRETAAAWPPPGEPSSLSGDVNRLF